MRNFYNVVSPIYSENALQNRTSAMSKYFATYEELSTSMCVGVLARTADSPTKWITSADNLSELRKSDGTTFFPKCFAADEAQVRGTYFL